MDRLNLLAGGTAICASDLATVLADHKKITPEKLIDELAAGQVRIGHRTTHLPELLRAVRKGPREMAELLVGLFVRDEDAFLDLIVEAGDYAATRVSMLAVLGISPVEDTLAALEITVGPTSTRRRPAPVWCRSVKAPAPRSRCPPAPSAARDSASSAVGSRRRRRSSTCSTD
ncbi:hypothetical protein ACFC0M_15560 [Streptomyces sp. NPDC056149]|uniref:hypothetical protein n=1 Tax=Streptomyces sp. NPDC056149 TaxID=3345728 RepID=UPI0035D67F9D